MKDVIFYEAFDEEQQALRQALPAGIAADFTRHTIQEDTPPTAPPAKIISTRTQSLVPPSWAHDIALLTRSTGYDHIRAYRHTIARHVPAGYLPLYCHRAVAEHALLLILSLLRKLPRQQHFFSSFTRDGVTGYEMSEKKISVFGVGNIGGEIIKIARALHMDCAGVDIVQRHEDVKYITPEEGLARADILVCAMNLTDENTGYFTEEKLRMLPRGAIFVNIARGELSSPQALLTCLEDGHLAGVGMDVYPREQAFAVALRTGTATDKVITSDPDFSAIMTMAQRDDVICTPHAAFNTHEAVARKAAHTIEQVTAFLTNGAFIWPVPE